MKRKVRRKYLNAMKILHSNYYIQNRETVVKITFDRGRIKIYIEFTYDNSFQDIFWKAFPRMEIFNSDEIEFEFEGIELHLNR